MRQPVVAGSFYEAGKEELKAQIEHCFLSELGPGKLPRKDSKATIRGAIVPHAGYYFSGACAAHAYKEIAESNCNRFVILGVNHFGYESGVSGQDWMTPLGEARHDKELINFFRKKGLPITESPHLKEHSIEVQLPFLQFVKEEFTFAAVGIGHDADIERYCQVLSGIKDAIFIVSSDFTHFGFNYGYLPFSANIKSNLEKLDMGAIDLILEGDHAGFTRYVNRTGTTICGYLPIITFLKTINKQKGKLLKYYTSGDVLGDYRNSVSYASIVY